MVFFPFLRGFNQPVPVRRRRHDIRVVAEDAQALPSQSTRGDVEDGGKQLTGAEVPGSDVSMDWFKGKSWKIYRKPLFLPSNIGQLSWFITPITMVYGIYNYSYWGL